MVQSTPLRSIKFVFRIICTVRFPGVFPEHFHLKLPHINNRILYRDVQLNVSASEHVKYNRACFSIAIKQLEASQPQDSNHFQLRIIVLGRSPRDFLALPITILVKSYKNFMQINYWTRVFLLFLSICSILEL